MAQFEEDILAEGAQIIWVLESDRSGRRDAATAQECRTFMRSRGSDKGWCVGDAQTQPTPGVFDAAPFAIGRGFDMILRRDAMRVLWVSTHGTPSGNENLDGQAVLDAVRMFSGP
ncbi:MAG: hypothetical protein AAFU79_07550 [Myxococcota bacterium]